MAKYDPLIALLEATSSDSLRLSFGDVEKTLKDRLPESARKYAAWWANSSVEDTHSWAHAWQAAGWKASVQLAAGMVEFRRVPQVAASVLSVLRPKTRQYVMDLVKLAGIDVTDWEFSADGHEVKNPRANPRFCYDWSFGNATEGYVLCIWHELLEERNGRVVYNSDYGAHTKQLRDRLQRAGATREQRGRLLQQIRRSEAFEEALNSSFHADRAVRIILNAGDMHSDQELGDAAAAVRERSLDVAEWFVHRIDDGDALIVRGERGARLVEGKTDGMHPPETVGEDDKWREGQIRIRQGQAAFRSSLLVAYRRRCAVTGCILEPVLEAAHIIPHAEGTDYRTSNGLLLRSDIHTLFDLYHLSVDSRGQIYLSKEAMNTDYRQFHGKTIRLPDLSSEQPALSNLESRHTRFLLKEKERL
jgi:hypothetical protein